MESGERGMESGEQGMGSREQGLGQWRRVMKIAVKQDQ